MKKLNNKGFAISMMLYSLVIVALLLISIVMSTMAFSRSQSKGLVDKVTDDLENLKLNRQETTFYAVFKQTDEYNLTGNLTAECSFSATGGCSVVTPDITDNGPIFTSDYKGTTTMKYTLLGFSLNQNASVSDSNYDVETKKLELTKSTNNREWYAIVQKPREICCTEYVLKYSTQCDSVTDAVWQTNECESIRRNSYQQCKDSHITQSGVNAYGCR